MPTLVIFGGLRSESAIKTERENDMSELTAKAKAPTSSSDTNERSMSASEALAIAWTGIESLGRMGKAKVSHSPKTGRVYVELIGARYDTANGLVPLATGVEPLVVV